MSATGEFVRDTKYLDGRFTADGRDGTFPAEAGGTGWRSWTFDLDPGEVDPVLGIHFQPDRSGAPDRASTKSRNPSGSDG